MVFKVDLIPSAHNDLKDTIEYYFNIYPSLAQKFYLEFDDIIVSLEKNPFFEIRYSNVRCKHLRSFPYNMHFIVDEKISTVSVIANAFSKQDRTNFKSRFD